MTDEIVLRQNALGIWDFQIENGDILLADNLDSVLVYALLGEQRAVESEVSISSRRRGWIGNEGETFENGSKLWLFEQARITRSVLNDIQATALNALNYLVQNNLVTNIQAIALLQNNQVILDITIEVSSSRVENRTFVLWGNTGRPYTVPSNFFIAFNDSYWQPINATRLQWVDGVWRGISTMGLPGSRRLLPINNWAFNFKPRAISVEVFTGPNALAGETVSLEMEGALDTNVRIVSTDPLVMEGPNQVLTIKSNLDFSIASQILFLTVIFSNTNAYDGFEIRNIVFEV